MSTILVTNNVINRPSLITKPTGNTSAKMEAPPIYYTPNILNNASFETDFSGFTNGSLTTPPANGGAGGIISRDSSSAYDGSVSLKRILPDTTLGAGIDDSPQVFYWRPGGSPLAVDRLQSRYYFKIGPPTPSTGMILKFNLYFSDGFNEGWQGLYIHGSGTGFQWFFYENLADGSCSVLAPFGTVCDGNWHCMEVDYWLNGDTSYDGQDRPSVALWLDGNLLAPNDTAKNKFANGKINMVATRTYPTSKKLGVFAFHGVLNNLTNSIESACWLDKVSLSTAGRIGP